MKITKVQIGIYFLLFCRASMVSAVISSEDSLALKLKSARNDKQKIEVYHQFYEMHNKSNPVLAKSYLFKARDLALEIKDSLNVASSWNRLGNIYQFEGQFDSALIAYNQAYELYGDLKDTSNLAQVTGAIGIVYRKQGNYEDALAYQIQSLRWLDTKGDSSGMADVLHNIGGIYYYMDELDEAAAYFEQSLKINHSLKRSLEMAKNRNNLGSVYVELKQYDKAIAQYLPALQFFRENGYERFVAILLDNLGMIYESKEDYRNALQYHTQALEVHERTKNSQRIAYTLNNIGNLYVGLKDFSKAENHFMRALDAAKTQNHQEAEYQIYHSLAEMFHQAGNYKQAYEYIMAHNQLHDSLFNLEKHAQIAEMREKYETDKKNQQIELQQVEILAQQAKLKSERFQKYMYITLALSLLVVLILITYRYFEKQRTNRLLEEKNRNILESLNYARKIQAAILPPKELLESSLNDYFILYLPRDIVSGDFYWFARKNKMTIIAAADCTGHGVPGAFMSMLGFTLLNEITSNTHPLRSNLILNSMRDKVKTSLRQKTDSLDHQDGMDIALCIIDEENKVMQYAGANNPRYLIRNKQRQKYKPDRMPVGIQIKEKESFTNHEIHLQEDDRIYLFSDGYIDQFGGTTGTKFKAAKFENMLLNIHHLNMHRQREILHAQLNDWKGAYEQIDDILVFGLKV